MIANENLKVGEAIEGIANKEFTKADLAEIFNVTTKTITNHLGRLAFKWNGKRHEYKGDIDQDIINAIELRSLLDGSFTIEVKLVESETDDKIDLKAEAEVEVETVANTEAKQTVKEKANAIDFNSIYHKELPTKNFKIDLLLAGKKTDSAKTYRGFYIDNDLLEVIDERVPNGNKSELINELIREAFEERGLIK